jgi:hypothetical protein
MKPIISRLQGASCEARNRIDLDEPKHPRIQASIVSPSPEIGKKVERVEEK